MSLSTLFPGSTQDATEFTIQKATLPTLTAVADNPGQEIISAMIFRASQVYTQAEHDANQNSRFYVEENLPTTATKTVNGVVQSFIAYSFTVTVLSPIGQFDADDAA